VLSEIVIRAVKDPVVQILVGVLVVAIFVRHVDLDLIEKGIQVAWQLLMWITD
jgi:hypothetical protein